MAEIKAITFDIGGTLAKGGLDKERYQSEVIDQLEREGFEIKKRKYQEATERALQELGRKRKDMYEMKYEDFCSMILTDLGISPNIRILDEIKELYFKYFRQKACKGSKSCLMELSKKYKLAAVSNSMSPVSLRFLERNDLASYFDKVTFSFDVGRRKPHPSIFERTLDDLGVKPNETIHVGNLLDEDVKGAKEMGMYTILTDPRELREDEINPDVTVSSIQKVPEAVENLISLGLDYKAIRDRCWLCSSGLKSLFKVNFEVDENFGNLMPLCYSCFKDFIVKRGRELELKGSTEIL